ncbi:MAG: single-stranded-DNA-specific exonuclease RecJ [Bacillota bacterium]
MEKIWEIKATKIKNKQKNNKKEILNKLLDQRGICSPEAKKRYLKPKLSYLSDPFLMPEMDKAVNRIKKAVKNKQQILIYGDYDVDGITSTALLSRFFKKAFNFEVKTFIPDRIKDGYGLSLSALKKNLEFDLIITVDCGITAIKEAEFLKDQGIDLIITDHHTPSDLLPEAKAIINHHLVKIDNYFAAEIAGVGTAYKLAQALSPISIAENKAEFLPLVALGTVADIAPLKNENRIFVKKGLQLLVENEVLGLKILIEELKLDLKNISAGQIGYIIAPPLNAAGRIDNPKLALNLLISENKEESIQIAKKLIKTNKKRQKQEEKIYKNAESKIKNLNLEKEKSIILADSSWHSGIIGIVASRLLEKYNLPVILFAIDSQTKTAKGSARSIANLNIYRALKSCQSKIIDFGGHKAAAGLSLELDNFEKFKSLFQDYLKNNLSEEDYVKKIKIDLDLSLEVITKEFILKLQKFKPFGVSNPAPKFIFKNLKAKKCYQMGKDNKHLKIYLENGVQAVAFNLGKQAAAIESSNFDLVAQPEINYWQGKENLQLKVKDYRLTADSKTVLVFKNENYLFYDYRNQLNKKNTLLTILNSGIINQGAVYLNQKKQLKYLKSDQPEHYFFGSEYQFENEFSHLIFYSLPFSLTHFYKIINAFQKSQKQPKIKIILLFTELDFKYNCQVIAYLKKQEIAVKTENELDFKGSIRYNKLSRRMDNCRSLEELAFQDNLFELITNVSNFKEDKNGS